MPRRQHITVLTIIGVAAFIVVCLVSTFRNKVEDTQSPEYNLPGGALKLDDGILHGEATAPKLENATLKYVLGKLVWTCANLLKGLSWETQHGRCSTR